VPIPDYVGPDVAALESAALAAKDGGFFFGKPMAMCESLIHLIHDSAGLPWYASIALATVAGRVALFPLQVFTSRSTAAMTLIQPQQDALQKRMKDGMAKRTPAGFKDAEKARSELSSLYARHNVRPWATIASAVGTLPVWMTFFFTVRMMCHRDGIGLSEGGALWFTDLTAADPYVGLPVLTSATFLLMAELGDAGRKGAGADANAGTIKKVMRGAAVLMIPATMTLESGLFCYWGSANLLAITQTLLLRNESVRALVGMPAAPKNPGPSSFQKVSTKLISVVSGTPADSAAPQKAFIPEVTYATSPKAPPRKGKGATGKAAKRSRGRR